MQARAVENVTVGPAKPGPGECIQFVVMNNESWDGVQNNHIPTD